MAAVTFACPGCGNTFQAPAERIPAEGARGKCKQCGMALTIYQDGHAVVAEATAPQPQQPPDDPVWELRPQNPNSPVPRRPYAISDVGKMIVDGQLFEDDQARVHQGAWMFLTAYPALNSFWARRAEFHQEIYGDPGHCAIHPDRKPGWRCPKCHNFLCTECVINRPLIEGGAARYLCFGCEVEAQPVKRDAGLKKFIPGVLKK